MLRPVDRVFGRPHPRRPPHSRRLDCASAPRGNQQALDEIASTRIPLTPTCGANSALCFHFSLPRLVPVRLAPPVPPEMLYALKRTGALNHDENPLRFSAVPLSLCSRGSLGATIPLDRTARRRLVRAPTLARGQQLHSRYGHQRTRNVAGGYLRSSAHRPRTRLGRIHRPQYHARIPP